MGGTYLVLYILTALTPYTNAVGTGASCSVKEDCVQTNYHSHCYSWLTDDSCPNGVCRCDSGYGGNLCVRLSTIKGYDEICNSTWLCDTELHCNSSSGRCVCATRTYVYKEAVKLCLGIHSRVFNETCTNSSECYNREGAEGGIECRGTTTKTCQCKPGYVEIGGFCQIPHYGQGCTTDVGCTMMSHSSVFIDDPSRVTEQCVSNVCVCPHNSEMLILNAFGAVIIYCLENSDEPKKYTGDICTTSSECFSKVCMSCPGSLESTKRCVSVLSSSPPERITTDNVVLLLMTTLLSTFIMM